MTATLGAGLALKPAHYEAALSCDADGMWFEVHPENYYADGGPRLAWLEAIRSRHPVALHGVGLSLASASAPDPAHLGRLAALLMHGVEADWTVRKGAVWWLAVRERGGQPQVYLKAVMTPDLCAR